MREGRAKPALYSTQEVPPRDSRTFVPAISTLKRAFGLDRCNWEGWQGFKCYVWSSIFAYNLQVIARIRLNEKAKAAA